MREPTAVLLEAHRVLAAGGLIYLTVPYLNRRPQQSGTTVPTFTPKSASALLATAGLTLIDTRPSSLGWGFPQFGRVAARMIAPLLRPYASTLLIVGRK